MYWKMKMRILKFGGSSLNPNGKYSRVLEIISDKIHKNDDIAVICSAFEGVTDFLAALARNAVYQDAVKTDVFQRFVKIHQEAVQSFLDVWI